VLVVPRLLGWRTVTVLSGSMAPAYPVNTVLAIDPVDPAEVHKGDVIAFATEADRPMVTHRVVAIERNAGGLSFITKGDANEAADRDAVTASAVRGRVVFGVPYLGSFVRATHNPIGFAVILVLPAVLLIGQQARSIRRERRTAKASTEHWAPPLANEAVAGPEEFDFWTTMATEDRYYEELEHEVHA
jgi:signal peptidase I